MKLYAVITREREEKTRRIMEALVGGWGEPACVWSGLLPRTGDFAVWGQTWDALDLIPQARLEGRSFWHIDNGYHKPARGGRFGYYRICRNGMSPLMIKNAPPLRHLDLETRMSSWRKTGNHVLIALPGLEYGKAMGMDMPYWASRIVDRVTQYTDRPIVMRPRDCTRPLLADLHNCWAVVTHSSNVATDAVLQGIPAFVALTGPTAFLGNLTIDDIESPKLSDDRELWWRSLMAQQFTIDEMQSGLAYEHLRLVDAEMCEAV